MILIKKIINILKFTTIKKILLIEFLTLALDILEVTRPFFMGKSIDDILRSDINTVAIKLVFYTITILLSSFLDYYQAIIMTKTNFEIELGCSRSFIQRFLGEKSNLYSKINEIVLGDIAEVSKIAVQVIDIIIFNSVSAILVIYFCLRIHYSLTVIIIVSLPFLYCINNLLGQRIESMNTIHKNSIDELNEEFTYLKTGIPVVKSLNATEYLEQKINKFVTNVNKLKFRISYYFVVKNTVLEISNYLVYLAILIIGIVLIHNQKITIGQFIAFNSYSAILTKNFNSLTEVMYMSREFRVSYDRIFDSNNMRYSQVNYVNSKDYSIALNNVSFKIGNIKILKSISYNFPKTGLIFIVGESGSGKTSLLKAMDGLIPEITGTVSVSTSNSNILYLPQTPVIFKDSIYNNIVLGKVIEEIEFLEVVKQLKIQYLLKKDNLKNPDSLDQTLSGGEKQRISFARAILANPDILLLDEFDSALDNENSEQLHKIIRELSKEKLILLATHDMSRIDSQDQCILIENGRIKEVAFFEDVGI